MSKKSKKPLVAFCKSYIGDLERVKNLISSFTKYNSSNIDLFLSVPKKDRKYFDDLKTNNRFEVSIISDEDIIKLCSTEKGMLKYKKWDGRLSPSFKKLFANI